MRGPSTHETPIMAIGVGAKINACPAVCESAEWSCCALHEWQVFRRVAAQMILQTQHFLCCEAIEFTDWARLGHSLRSAPMSATSGDCGPYPRSLTAQSGRWPTLGNAAIAPRIADIRRNREIDLVANR